MEVAGGGGGVHANADSNGGFAPLCEVGTDEIPPLSAQAGGSLGRLDVDAGDTSAAGATGAANEAEGGEDSGPGEPGEVRRVVCAASLGFFLFGYDTGVVSGASDWAQEDLSLSDLQKGVCVGATCIAAALACVWAAPLNARLGRRRVVLLSSLLYLAGAAVVAGSVGVLSLAGGRVLLGVAIGLATCTVPLYTAESVPPRRRGEAVALNDLCVAVGQVAAGLVNVLCEGAGRRWRVSMGVAAVPAAVQALLLLRLEESPRWAAAHGDEAGAAAIFRRLHGTGAEAEAELRGMQAAAAAAAGTGEKSFSRMWRGAAAHRRAMYVGVVLMVMNQASGINTVMYYSSPILKAAGFSERAAIWGALLCDVTQSAGVCVSIGLMERVGRRPLAIVSALAVAPCIAALGLSFSASLQVLSAVSLAAYLFAFGLGLSGVPWTVNAEIFPLTIRSKAQAQSIFTNWFLNGLIALAFPVFVGSAPHLFFYAFAVVAAVGAWWMYRFMPETKGLRLEQIDALFAVPLREAALRARGVVVGADAVVVGVAGTGSGAGEEGEEEGGGEGGGGDGEEEERVRRSLQEQHTSPPSPSPLAMQEMCS